MTCIAYGVGCYMCGTEMNEDSTPEGGDGTVCVECVSPPVDPFTPLSDDEFAQIFGDK
jgi:hypothetical protein